MADFDTYFVETEDAEFYGILDLTLPVAWEPGTSSDDVVDSIGDVIDYCEEMRRAILTIERAGGKVVVSEEFEDALDVYFDSRAEAEAALEALTRRDLLDFLVQNPAEHLEEEDDGEDEGGPYGGNGHSHLN